MNPVIVQRELEKALRQAKELDGLRASAGVAARDLEAARRRAADNLVKAEAAAQRLTETQTRARGGR
ncbi:hypothetical protein [Embleya sp. NPDC020630]|uniref:hypothetical protein n=1 Tax=Embleya sp. NPDC020630 TaxID=3363979 RepID=UPI0037B204A6